MNNIVKASAGPNAQNRYRFRTSKEELSFLAQQVGVLVLDMGNERYLAVDAYALLQELERTNTIAYAGVYFFELDMETDTLYKEDSDEVLDCEEVHGEGMEFLYEHLIEYTKENGIYRLRGVFDVPSFGEEEGDRLTAMRGKNVTITNHPSGWCCVRLHRMRYAAREGYRWIFCVWREAAASQQGGYVKRYSCYACDLLELIQSGRLNLINGGHTLYIQYENGEVYTNAAFTEKVMQLTPVRSDDFFGMLRSVPTSDADAEIPASNGRYSGMASNSVVELSRPFNLPSSSEEKQMSIDELSLLLDKCFRKGRNVDNKRIINIVLSYAKVALGEEGMLALLQEMEQCGGNIPWAYDATGVAQNALVDALCDMINGVRQIRYYDNPISVCGRTYYISSQWYSHVRYPHQRQTKKALLQMVCRKIPREYVGEYIDRLIQSAQRERQKG